MTSETFGLFGGTCALLWIFFPHYYFCSFEMFAGITGWLVLIVPIIIESFTPVKFSGWILPIYAKICYYVIVLSILHLIALLITIAIVHLL
jgi:hypothetical protein